jgi:hypothetical protein
MLDSMYIGQLEHACGVFEYISATIASRIVDGEPEEKVVGDVLIAVPTY